MFRLELRVSPECGLRCFVCMPRMVLYGIVAILVCMQGWKENLSLTESMNDAYERMSSHLWIKRILMYSIFGFIAFVFTYMFIHFDLFYTESDSAKYLLSALVQSQAAIIGIVITLTFIAVQLIFSYSPRAVGVALKRNCDMWMLLIFYGISIFYGLFVLRMIPNDLDGSLGQIDFLTMWGSPVSLGYRICFAYCLGILTFVAIVPYILNTVNFLSPANIIKILSHDITESKILKHIKSVEEHEKDRTIPIEEDPVLPIVDIIKGSVMKYDFESAKNGLEAITDRTIEICNSNKYSDIEDDIISISRHFCYHLALIGIFAVRNVNEIYIEVIRALKIFGVSMAEKGFEGAAAIAAESMLQFGTIAVQKGLDVTMQTAKSLAELINSSEYVSRTIEEYESELGEEEIAAFQKIMKRCGQELEKLRAEVSK